MLLAIKANNIAYLFLLHFQTQVISSIEEIVYSQVLKITDVLSWLQNKITIKHILKIIFIKPILMHFYLYDVIIKSYM